MEFCGKMLRLLVCGGRNYSDKAKVWEVLSGIKDKHGMNVFLCEGDASGADYLAKEFAKSNGWDRVSYPANWARYGNSAGPIRNQKMFDEFKPDLCIAFPGHNGTKNMVMIC